MSTAETDKPARAKTGIGAHLGSHLRENGMMLSLLVAPEQNEKSIDLKV